MDQEHKELIKELNVPIIAQRDKDPVIVTRKSLTDAEKYNILLQYSQGIPIKTIAAEVGRDTHSISSLIDQTISALSSVKETNDLLKVQCTADFQKIQGTTPTKFLSSEFLHAIPEFAEVYAYYYAQTGDNKFSLQQSQLDKGIPFRMPKQTKDYVLRVRGQYLRDIPQVKRYIKEIQDRRIQEYRIEKPQVQMELVHQVEELKEAAAKEPRQRGNLLKAIELLGRTIGAFTDRVEVEEVNAKSGLQMILEKARKEVLDATPAGYSIEDIEEDDGDTEEAGSD